MLAVVFGSEIQSLSVNVERKYAMPFQSLCTGDCCLRLMRLEPEADLHPSQTVGRFDRERRQGGGHFFSTCGPRPTFAMLL
jgi:hypothetical protein